MSDLNFSIGMQFNPELNPQKLAEVLNVIIREMKSKLGALGDNLDLIDGDSMAKELDKVRQKYEQISDGVKKTSSDTDTFTKSITNAEGKASLLGKAFQFNQITQSLTTFSSALGAFTQPFADLDKQVKNIGTLGVQNFEEFADAALDLSQTVPDSAADIAGGVYDAISAGTIKVKDGVADVAGGMKFVETASKLATAGLTSTGDAINGLTSVMNAYGIEADRSAEVADLFFGAVNVGKTTIPELNASLANVIPTAAAFGVSFDQVSAAIATMTKQGTPTATATTQIRSALVELAKPGATLAPILQKAGVSLDSLKREGLQESMRKVGEALKMTGKSATQVFSSVEAAGAVMLLSGKNAQMAAEDFEAVAGSIGSTDYAFGVASAGIEVQSKIITNKVQAVFSSAFSSLGNGAITAVQSLNQIGPALAGLGGVAAIIPSGSGKAVADFSKSIISKLIPSLIVTSATSGATSISFSAMWAAALGPIGLVIAGVAAVGTALYFLGDYLVETNEEKLESAKADEEMIAGQKKVNEAEQNSIKSKQALIDQYEKLGSKSSLTANEQKKLKDTITQLNEVYPGAISSTKSFEENMKSLNQESEKNSTKIKELQNSMSDLDEQAKKATIIRVELETEVSAESLEENVLDEIDNIFGANSNEQRASVSKYVDSIKDAANPEEAKRALLAFNTALWNNPMFKDLPPEAREALAKQAQEFTDTRIKELDEKTKQAQEKLGKLVNSFAEKGITDLSQMSTKQRAEFEVTMKASGKSKEEVEKMMDDADKAIRDKKLGEVISESTKVNGKLKASESLGDLVESYKNAETEIQRSAIGEKMKSIAPDAVQATGVVIGENGELVRTYKILDDKIQESAQKQKELNSAKLDSNQAKYIESIEKEGEKYKENEVKMGELQAKISEKVKMGADTSDLEQEYDTLKGKNDGYLNDIAGMAAKWASAGLSTEQVFKKIADATGKPIEEVEKLVGAINKSKEAVQGTESAVKSLGDAFSEDLKAAGDKYNSQLQELVGLERKKEEAKAKGNKKAIKEAEAEWQAQYKLTKEANSQLKSLEKTKKSQEDLFAEKKEKSETAYQIATKAIKQDEVINKNSMEQFKIEQEMNIALEGRKKTTEDDLILKTRQLQSLEAEKKSILENYKIIENSDGTIEIGIKVKKEEQSEVKAKVDEINNKIANENVGVVQLNSTLKLEESEIKKKVEEQNRKSLEYQVEIGLKPRIELVNDYEDELIKIASEVQTKKNKIEGLNELKISGKITYEQQAELKKLETEVIDSENKQFEIKKNIKEQYTTIYDEELEQLREKNSKELTEVEKRIEDELKLREVFIETASSVSTASIDKEYDERLSKLDRLKEAELISEGLFNEKKEALELEHQKKLQVIQEMGAGAKLESQRQADLSKLNLEQEQLQKELDIERIRAEQTGDTKKLDELNAKMSDVESKIKEKGDVITFLATNLQGSITDIFSSITGSEEEMKEPWRKAFSVVAGALKQLATSAVTTLILGQLKINAAMGGIATLVLIPAITGIVNAGVSAILNPVLSGLLSFSTGGRVDKPTLAIVGDASEARPGSNTEWILRDDQMRLIMKNVVASFIKEVNQINEYTSTKDIKKLNEIIINQSMYEFSKHKSTENVEVYNELLNNFSKVNGNFFNIIDEVYTNTKINIKEVNKGIINEDIKRYIIEEYSLDKQHLYNNSVISEKLSNAMSNLNEIKTIFKKESFTFENFNDYITNYNTYSKTKSEYIDNKIPTREYKELEAITLSKYNSYINNSTPTNLNSVQLGNNNHSILPNDILTSSQFESIINKAIQTSNNNISKKFDKLIDVVNNLDFSISTNKKIDKLIQVVENLDLDFSISDESIHKSIQRISKSGKRRART